MSIGLTQLILIIVIGIILFGNIPKVFKDIGTGVMAFKSTISKETTISDKDPKVLPSQSEKDCDISKADVSASSSSVKCNNK